jgi:DNA-directed RNA polymerase beta subunit
VSRRPSRRPAQLFDTLFFDSERYDLSAVGRVKMNMRLDLGKPDTQRTLDRDDIVACIKALTELRDGKGEIDDIDHLGNRRVRSVGELMENQYRVGLAAHGARDQGAHVGRSGRDRHDDAARPDQRQTGGGGGA